MQNHNTAEFSQLPVLTAHLIILLVHTLLCWNTLHCKSAWTPDHHTYNWLFPKNVNTRNNLSSQSPDLNPNPTSVDLTGTLAVLQASLPNLANTLVTEWAQLPIAKLQNLVKSLPNKVAVGTTVKTRPGLCSHCKIYLSNYVFFA